MYNNLAYTGRFSGLFTAEVGLIAKILYGNMQLREDLALGGRVVQSLAGVLGDGRSSVVDLSPAKNNQSRLFSGVNNLTILEKTYKIVQQRDCGDGWNGKYLEKNSR